MIDFAWCYLWHSKKFLPRAKLLDRTIVVALTAQSQATF